MSDSTKGRYGLRATCLSFPETLAQSVANISPTLTPVVIVPLVYASAGRGTWLAYLFATIGLLLVGANINQFARNSATPGSLYSYVTRGLGVNTGFLAGWSLLFAYVLTGAAVMSAAVSYTSLLLDLLHLHVPQVVLFAIGCVLAWAIAYRDVKLSARVMLVLELASMALILALGVVVMRHHGEVVDARQFDFSHMDFAGVRAGLILAVFSYVGFESATTLGEEARNPLQNIPRSVLLSALISGLFFMVTAYIAILGFKGATTSLADSTAPFNDLAGSVGRPVFGVLISIGAVISLFACVLANINSGARIMFTMSRHGIFHPHMAKPHATNDTPHHALSVASLVVFVLSAGLLFAGVAILDVFNDLSTIATYGFLLVYALISIAAPVYLKRRGQLTRGAVGLSLLSLLFMAAPIVATVYPLPAPPGDRFPVYFALYVAVGIGWYVWLRSRASSIVMEEITRDMEFDHPP